MSRETRLGRQYDSVKPWGESLKQLQALPRIGSAVRCSIPGLRCWPVKGFESIRIYYLESPRNLRVVRILHGSRNVRRILKEQRLS